MSSLIIITICSIIITSITSRNARSNSTHAHDDAHTHPKYFTLGSELLLRPLTRRGLPPNPPRSSRYPRDDQHPKPQTTRGRREGRAGPHSPTQTRIFAPKAPMQQHHPKTPPNFSGGALPPQPFLRRRHERLRRHDDDDDDDAALRAPGDSLLTFARNSTHHPRNIRSGCSQRRGVKTTGDTHRHTVWIPTLGVAPFFPLRRHPQ